MENFTVAKKLNELGQKELHNLIVKLQGEGLGFNPFLKGYPTGGKKKVDCIQWILKSRLEMVRSHFEGKGIYAEPQAEPQAEPMAVNGNSKPETATATINPSNPLDGLMDYIMKHAVKPEQVEKIVNDTLKKALESAPVNTIIYNKAEKTKVKLDVTHSQFEEIFKAVTAPSVNVCLVGPSGSGKTSIAKQIATALGYEFCVVSITAGVSEGSLTGWLLPIGDKGKFLWVDSIALEKWRTGNCVILIDEMDAGDANTLLIANMMLSQQYLFVAQRIDEPKVTRGENTIVIGAMNTFGTGADMVYSGREQLDGATLARFIFIEMDYCKKLETAIVKNTELLEWAFPIRKAIKKNRIQRLMSTHTLLQYASLLKHSGWTMSKVEKNFFQSWSRDEKSKVLAMAE